MKESKMRTLEVPRVYVTTITITTLYDPITHHVKDVVLGPKTSMRAVVEEMPRLVVVREVVAAQGIELMLDTEPYTRKEASARQGIALVDTMVHAAKRSVEE